MGVSECGHHTGQLRASGSKPTVHLEPNHGDSSSPDLLGWHCSDRKGVILANGIGSHRDLIVGVGGVESQFMKKNLIIISAGKSGREIFGWAADAIRAGAPWCIRGFLDNRTNALDGFNYESKIIGNVHEYRIEADDVFVGAIGDPKDKVTYYTPILERGGSFINLIHPSASAGHNAQLGTGVVMAPFTCLTSDVKLGNFVTVLPFSNIAHDCVVGPWSQISPHCGINGKVTLGEGVFLGGHSCIIPEKTVGAWTYVGAGSVVNRDIPPGMRVVGNPARPIASGERN
jgi:sugar O-acyltransferase (sialic acid O-acetyltransferase NeuD family)